MAPPPGSRPGRHKADLEALPSPGELRSLAAPRTAAAKPLPSIVTIPTYVHVIKGTHRGERTPAGPKRVRTLMTILNNAMAGHQSSASTPSRFRFVLTPHRLHQARRLVPRPLPGAPRPGDETPGLHVGNARTLNLYITGGPTNIPLLGWARFPWEYASAPKLDSVTITTASLPGGRAIGLQPRRHAGARDRSLARSPAHLPGWLHRAQTTAWSTRLPKGDPTSAGARPRRTPARCRAPTRSGTSWTTHRTRA